MLNKNIGSKIIGNASILAITQIASKVLGTIFIIIMARTLPVSDYGIFAYAGAIGEMFGMVVAFGFPILITRNIARDLDRTKYVYGAVLPLEAILLVLASVGIEIVLIVLKTPFPKILIVSILCLVMLLNSIMTVITGFFRAHQRMLLEAAVRLPVSVLNLGFGLIVLLAGLGVLAIAFTQLSVIVLMLLVAFILMARKIAKPILSLDMLQDKKLLLMALPFALSSLFIYVYHNIDLIFLSSIKGDTAAGYYAAASNFTQIFNLLPASIMAAFLPVMAQFWTTSRESWNIIYSRSLKYLLIISLPIAVGMSLLSRQIMSLVMGQQYEGATGILSIMALGIILVFLNYGLSNALVSVDKEKTYLRIIIFVMIFNIVVNLGAIPIFGVLGAAVTSLLTEGLMLIAQFFFLLKAGLRISVLGNAAKPVLSVLIMGLCVYLTTGTGLLGAMAVGVVVYPLSLILLKTFNPDEIAQIIHFWSEGPGLVMGRLKQKIIHSS